MSNHTRSKEHTVAKEKMTAVETLRTGLEPSEDWWRDLVRWTVQAVLEAEVSAQIGAARSERSGERATYRKGYRPREWDTRVGTLELAIPKLRAGRSVPRWLEPRRRSEQALVAVVTEASVQGVSTRRVEALVQSLGIVGISTSEVSRLCAQLDEQVEAVRGRRLEAARYPYGWLDARSAYVREEHQVQAMAVVIADGVRDDGVREVLGRAIGPSEATPLGRAFLQSLVARGLRGVRLVISDAHRGLKQASRAVVVGAAWQHCRGQVMRTIVAHVPTSAQALVAATVRTIVAQPDRPAARAHRRQVGATLAERCPRVVALLEAAEGEILTFYDFPKEHWRQVYATNPLERLNKELKRRSAVVGIFPNRAAVLRLFGARLAEQMDEGLVGQRSFSLGSMATLLAPAEEEGARAAETTIALA